LTVYLKIAHNFGSTTHQLHDISVKLNSIAHKVEALIDLIEMVITV